MDDLHKPFAHRPRKQSLSAIIEKIVLEKQRQKEKAIFEQQFQHFEPQRNASIAKIEPCELIEDSASAESCGGPPDPAELPLPAPTLTQEPGSQVLEVSQLASKAPAPSACAEEDEEMDEDESTEREDANIDPERLKAFNMFVRLFADEQLDRTIPISKQPKERIQTIIDSCSRQFPEFEDRARKRLRTYLKACRRHKKLREPLSVSDVGSLGRLGRTTPSYLTSAQAELILAQACQNETRNVKRRHPGVQEPQGEEVLPEQQLVQLPSVIPLETAAPDAPGSCTMAPAPAPEPAPAADLPCTQETPISSVLQPQPATSALYQADVGHLLRQVLPGRAGAPPPPPPHVAGGELFFHRTPHGPLSVAEAAAVRTLVDGYRQAASMLRRTADELEAVVLNGML